MIKKIIYGLVLGSAFLTASQVDASTRISSAQDRLSNLANFIKENPSDVLPALNGDYRGNASSDRGSVINPQSLFLSNSTETGGPLACQYEGSDATATPVLTDVDFSALKAAVDKSADNKAVVPYTAKDAKAPTYDLVVWGEKALGKTDLICYIPVVRN